MELYLVSNKNKLSKEIAEARIQRGNRIKAAREAMGSEWSQEFLAESVGTRQQTIQKLEKGEIGHSRYMVSIAEVLDIDFDDLDGGVSRYSKNSFLSKGGAKQGAGIEDIEGVVNIAKESISESINSLRAVNIANGKSPDELDAEILVDVFELSLRAKLTGDFLTTIAHQKTLQKSFK